MLTCAAATSGYVYIEVLHSQRRASLECTPSVERKLVRQVMEEP
jgi:hypothetical protein